LQPSSATGTATVARKEEDMGGDPMNGIGQFFMFLLGW
jgi:hypothetical protein